MNYLPSNPEITPFFGVAHVVADNVEEVLGYLNLDFESFLNEEKRGEGVEGVDRGEGVEKRNY